MASLIEFETPENVQITYRPAGLGTRFSAWLLDSFFVTLVAILLGFLAMVVAAAAGAAAKDVERQFGSFDDRRDIPLYFVALMVLVWGLGSFVYFTLSELLWRGQTVGKRACGVRVVKADGFALEAGSVLVRNAFRIVDQLPLLWIVPVLSVRSQRFGDMAAGTIVVADLQDQLGDLRTRLLARPAAESRFRFDGAMLGRAKPTDIDAAERILERWPQLSRQQQSELVARVVEPLSRRLGAQSPSEAQRHEFLEDFVAAVYRREARRLG